MRRDDADRAAVVGREVVAVEAVGELDARLRTLVEREVGRVPVERVEHDVFGVVTHAGALGEIRERDARELAVELAPARHAVEILSLGDGREVAELVERDGERLLDCAPHLEFERLRVPRGSPALREDGEPVGLALPRREPVVAVLAVEVREVLDGVGTGCGHEPRYGPDRRMNVAPESGVAREQPSRAIGDGDVRDSEVQILVTERRFFEISSEFSDTRICDATFICAIPQDPDSKCHE
ncbi:hypothetical protein BN903_5 [Halorubrum sp. AJ67]|nr:hypothetical protein BN903_5 [Halorubrum sp. AJ67]